MTRKPELDNTLTALPNCPTKWDHLTPWENGYCESFNARFRDELLNGEIFYSLKEAQIIIEEWRKHYNTKEAAQCVGLPPTCSRNHRAIRTMAGHALTFKLDLSKGADHLDEWISIT